MRVSVVGTGYLGATHAACLASWGHQVIGIDTDPSRTAQLSTGEAPFHEPHLDDLLRDGLTGGRLRFSTEIGDAAGAQVHFLCVGTPQAPDSYAADLSALWEAAHALAPFLGHEALVVGKSTVPVGTAGRLRDLLANEAPAGARVMTAWNPEFLREGYAVADSLRPDRIVLGVDCDEAHLVLRDVYAPLLESGVPAVRTDLATAELAKVSANVMLAARISVVNLLAEVCEAAGANVADLTRVLGLDKRIGTAVLSPGIGYGGGCLPKDTRAFMARASELGVGDSAGLLREVDAVNTRQRSRTAELAIGLLGDPVGAQVAVLGAAFKAGSDDLRDSPALDVAQRLLEAGAHLRVYDPGASDLAGVMPELERCSDVPGALRDSDLVLVLTDWPEFASLDPVSLLSLPRVPRILDGRLVLDPVKWRAAGWTVRTLGRAPETEPACAS